MIIECARLSASRLFTREFRAVLFKSLGLTLLFLAAIWFAVRSAFDALALPWMESFFPHLPGWAGWFGLIAAILAGTGLALALALLIAPITAAVAGIFLDDVAEVVERNDYPDDAPGTAMPAWQAAVAGIKFFGIVLIANIVALFLLFIPGINIAAFFVVNAYLLGREYFEFAATRHCSHEEARMLRRRNGGNVFLAGLVIAGFLAIPVVNLLTPLFAAAMMVHLYKHIAASPAGRAALQAG
jgi:CysZ protein